MISFIMSTYLAQAKISRTSLGQINQVTSYIKGCMIVLGNINQVIQALEMECSRLKISCTNLGCPWNISIFPPANIWKDLFAFAHLADVTLADYLKRLTIETGYN